MLKNSLILLDGSIRDNEALALLAPLMHHTAQTIPLLRFIPDSTEPASEELRFWEDDEQSFQIFERSCSNAHEVLKQATNIAAEKIVVIALEKQHLIDGAFATLVAQLLQHAQQPVILIGGKLQIADCRTILVVLDGTPESEEMLPLASELAYLNDARLVLMPPVRTRDETRYSNELVSRVANYLNWVAGSLRSTGLKATAIHLNGNAHLSIAARAERERADLILVAEHSATQDEVTTLLMASPTPVIVYGAKECCQYHRYLPPDVAEQMRARDLLPATS